MKVAAVQLNSTEEKSQNLATVERLTRAAAADGAELVLLPERMNVRGSHEAYVRAAETLDGPTVTLVRGLASELGIDLVAGSIVERREGREKLSNTCVHAGPDGELKAVYRKIHLFDVSVGGVDYLESASDEPGDEIVVSEAADGTPIGLSVCYDLRFPELYRILAIRGARVVTVPANFTKITGEAHWEVLLRARAIENQVFVVAAGQFGIHPGDQGETYGGSMIVDPWGEVLARAPEEECFASAELDFERQDEIRERLPSLRNRVPLAYRWPQEVPA